MLEWKLHIKKDVKNHKTEMPKRKSDTINKLILYVSDEKRYKRITYVICAHTYGKTDAYKL